MFLSFLSISCDIQIIVFAMDLEEAVKIGFLLVPPQSFLRKTWLKRYCAVYNASNHGIQRIEVFESEDAFVKQNPNKIIPLTDCIKVSPAPQKQQPNVFEVRTKNSVHQFSADTFQEMSEWLSSLQSVAFGKKVPKLSSSGPTNAKEEKQEENLLYSSMEEPEIYPVRAVSTEATLRNNLIGEYKLIITPVNLSVTEENSQGRMGRIILTWPYRHIRRYGCTTENFSFEAGRKCVSGEGLFTFSTNDGMLIFQSVDAHVLALKSSQHEFDMPSSPSLNEDKIFFTSKDSLSTDKFDQTVAMHGNENDSLVFQSKTSHKTAPLSKPPRKSKTSKSTYTSSSTVHRDVQNDSKFSPNLYEELFMGDTSDHLYLNSDSPGVPHQSYNNIEELNLSISDEKTLCFSTEKLHICEMPKQRDSSTFTSLDYENCDPTLHAKLAVSKQADHVYGKLLNTKHTLPAKDSSNIYGTILPKQNSGTENISSPVYSNVPFNSSDVYGHIQRDPDHFVKNDAEYAQVFKKSENSFM